MGLLVYGPTSYSIDIDDRALAHMKLVFLAKLRRSESFSFSWDTADPANGRQTVWMNPAIPLRFEFTTAAPEVLSRTWLELMTAAIGKGDFRLMDEPLAEDEGRRAP